jgi:hypothetical protein
MQQGIRRDMFGDAGVLCRIAAHLPDRLIGDWNIRTSALATTGEQIYLWPPPTPVRAERFQQFRAQRQIAIFASFALNDANDHALAVDVTHLEVDHLGPPHAGPAANRRCPGRMKGQAVGPCDGGRAFPFYADGGVTTVLDCGGKSSSSVTGSGVSIFWNFRTTLFVLV